MGESLPKSLPKSGNSVVGPLPNNPTIITGSGRGGLSFVVVGRARCLRTDRPDGLRRERGHGRRVGLATPIESRTSRGYMPGWRAV